MRSADRPTLEPQAVAKRDTGPALVRAMVDAIHRSNCSGGIVGGRDSAHIGQRPTSHGVVVASWNGDVKPAQLCLHDGRGARFLFLLDELQMYLMRFRVRNILCFYCVVSHHGWAISVGRVLARSR